MLVNYKAFKKIIGYSYNTSKNGMVSELYKDFGFDNVLKDKSGSYSIWVLQIENYDCKNKHIKVKND